MLNAAEVALRRVGEQAAVARWAAVGPPGHRAPLILPPRPDRDRCRRARGPRPAHGATPERMARQARAGVPAGPAQRRGASSPTRRSGEVNGTYSVTEPRALANSLIPVTELWLSSVSTNRVRGPNGYASPTSRHAPLALGVKMTAYSSAVR